MVTGSFKGRKVDLDFYLHRVFQKTTFRPLQREVIAAAVEGDDVFLQASTSFGKSLCFQLPAVISHGVTIVVCPLLALMTDQVNALQSIGVPVATINSTTSPSERREIMTDLLSGHPRTRLLYVTPELCQTEVFRRNLKTIHSQRELARIAIDEAHCISEWGHDFRPAYKQLGWFKEEFTNPPVPISAFTATATPRVRADIIKLLGLDPTQLRIFNTPSARPNIHYEIRYTGNSYSEDDDASESPPSQLGDFISWLKAIKARREARLGSDGTIPPVTGIIYVSLRMKAEQLASELSSAWDGNIYAVAYHAGLTSQDRTRIQSQWTSSKSAPDTKDEKSPAFYIVVATNAFGMGIDNPHVRFVVHWNPPRSFEGFVQESGRAGRDGCAAASVVYYSYHERDAIRSRVQRDLENAYNKLGARSTNGGGAGAVTPTTTDRNKLSNVQNQFARMESLDKVIWYCENTTRCRHEMIKEFFGDLELEMMGSQAAPSGGLHTDGQSSSPCDFACDFCKEGSARLAKRKQAMALHCEARAMDVDNHDGIDLLTTMRTIYPGAF